LAIDGGPKKKKKKKKDSWKLVFRLPCEFLLTWGTYIHFFRPETALKIMRPKNATFGRIATLSEPEPRTPF
jgi:hypothetical protein